MLPIIILTSYAKLITKFYFNTNVKVTQESLRHHCYILPQEEENKVFSVSSLFESQKPNKMLRIRSQAGCYIYHNVNYHMFLEVLKHCC